MEDISPLATAKINEERPFTLRTQQTVSRFSRFVLPGLRVGTVPVISGFFAVDSAERVVALGRGGSDITAFIVATQISADEVVIVTDVQGVLSADPRLAENPRLLDELTLDRPGDDLQRRGARDASAGAEVQERPSARPADRLPRARPPGRLRHVACSGKSETTLYRNPQELSMLTVVGDLGRARRGCRARCCAGCEAPACRWPPSTSRQALHLPVPADAAGRASATAACTPALREQLPGLTNISLRGGHRRAAAAQQQVRR